MIAKRLTAASLALGLAVSAAWTPSLSASAKSYGGEVDVSTSTFKSDTDNNEAFQTWKENVWSIEKADSGRITLTPGEDERDLNFAWYSEQSGDPAVKIRRKNQKESKATIIKGTAAEISQENWQGRAYTASNKVSVKDYFRSNTEYIYQYTDNYAGKDTVWSEEETFKLLQPSVIMIQPVWIIPIILTIPTRKRDWEVHPPAAITISHTEMCYLSV